MDKTIYDLIEPDVLTAAKSVAREWPGVIEDDDLYQDIWLVLLESSQEAQDLVAGMDRAQRVSALQTFGHRIAAKERDDYELFSGNFFYSVGHVRTLLEEGSLGQIYEPENRNPIVGTGFYNAQESPDAYVRAWEHEMQGPGTLMHSERIDLEIAMGKLTTKNARYAFILKQVYIHGNRPDRTDPERKVLNRAVDSLTLEMNRAHLRGGAV